MIGRIAFGGETACDVVQEIVAPANAADVKTRTAADATATREVRDTGLL